MSRLSDVMEIDSPRAVLKKKKTRAKDANKNQRSSSQEDGNRDDEDGEPSPKKVNFSEIYTEQNSMS